MGCCGGHGGSSFIPTKGGAGHGPTREFEYLGDGQLAIFGPVTGIRYVFGAQGARVMVDPRDARVFRLAADLRLVSGAAVS